MIGMGLKDPIKRKEYSRKYYKQHREKILKYCHDYYFKNIDKKKEYNRIYGKRRYEKNKNKIIARQKEYQKTHREERKIYFRENLLHSKGKWIIVRKRPYPSNNNCELCKRIIKRLLWHHWDDSKPYWGMWLCGVCHSFAERLDGGFTKSYLELKKKASEWKGKKA